MVHTATPAAPTVDANPVDRMLPVGQLFDVLGGRTAPHSPADTILDTDGQDSITRSDGSVTHTH